MYYHVISTSKPYLYQNIDKIPYNNVAMVLGTSKYVKRGGINPYFKYRLEAAHKLFKQKKIKHIIVSGDNHKKGYNEPQQMKEYLIKLGVPEKAITLDYAGFRTFDSVVRTNQIFGQKKFTIVSQKSHNQRAVFIGLKKGLDVVAFNAKDPYISKRMKIREFLAKINAFLDIYILNTKPKFKGKKIEIEF